MAFDFLELFNAVGTAQKVVTDDYIPAESLDTPITEDALNLDSLDVMLTFLVLGEAYGIPEEEELNDLWPVESIKLLQTFVQEHKTQDPEDEFDSVEALVEELG
jgi:acyl carrier protein|tara:strand:+ start:698 stop:1009 length:312 start_codon:yes stop_codon:yes gene_type:complete